MGNTHIIKYANDILASEVIGKEVFTISKKSQFILSI